MKNGDMNINNLTNSAKCILSNAIQESQSPDHLIQQIRQLLEDLHIEEKFMNFIHEQADDTWKLWVQYVFQDCYCYITLYLALDGSNWDLRVSSLKQMAPLFAVLDRSTHERIIPSHLADITEFPSTILQSLKSGGSLSTSVDIIGMQWH